jgi:hypothetical protein
MGIDTHLITSHFALPLLIRRPGGLVVEMTADTPHFCMSESPAYSGRAVAADPDVARWSGQVVSTGQLARVYGFTDTDGTRPDFWRYLVEVLDKDLPADATGYR